MSGATGRALARGVFGVLGFIAAFCATQAIAKEAKPLFSDDTILNIQLTAPFRDLVKKAPDTTDPYPATLTLVGDADGAGEDHAIALSARGNSRRDTVVCKFPPLRVVFDEKPADGSLFKGQKRLKLVTHCQRSRNYQQYYLLEYAAYKFLNIITPQSLRVRLANIDYIEADSGKLIYSRTGFFIEDTDDAAKRNGVKEIDVSGISVAQLNANAAARFALFQYMIGNLDWSMHDGLAGKDCCHNAKLIGDKSTPLSNLVPVPYDFDYSGIVDAPYAVPPEDISVRSVRTRRFRGFCAHNAEIRDAAAVFIEKRETIYGVLDGVPGLNNGKKNKSVRYLHSFFRNISDVDRFEKQLLDKCRS